MGLIADSRQGTIDLMKGLAGDFGTMSVADLVLYLGNRGHTGSLIFEEGASKKSALIKDGAIINTASHDPREYLGQFLINFGHITEDQLTKAFQTQSETRVMLGRILVMIGLVTEEVLKQVLAIKHRETLLSVFRWKEGTFKFTHGALPPDQDAVFAQVPLLELHHEAEFRETAWESMLQVFSRGDLVLKVDESKAPTDIPAHSLEGMLFALIREGQTLDEIGLKLHATDFHLYQRLYSWYRQGVVAPVESEAIEITVDAPEEPVGEEVFAPALLARARDFLTSGQLVDAEALAQRAVELDATPEARALLKEAEAGLLEQLRAEMVMPSKIPVLAIPMAKLKELGLSPQQKYLLSRVDGLREIRIIVRVSPIRELDALKAFKSFMTRGFLTLREPGH